MRRAALTLAVLLSPMGLAGPNFPIVCCLGAHPSVAQAKAGGAAIFTGTLLRATYVDEFPSLEDFAVRDQGVRRPLRARFMYQVHDVWNGDVGRLAIVEYTTDSLPSPGLHALVFASGKNYLSIVPCSLSGPTNDARVQQIIKSLGKPQRTYPSLIP